ncbi:MAG: gamma-glutamylcyclotransferase family protein [Pseudomonadota bacterium]
MPLYFAYGSNMSPRQMAMRCPGARPRGTAMLRDWRFIISKRGGANVIPAKDARVYGVLWQINGAHIAALNGWEGVAQGVYRRMFLPVMTDRGARMAVTYVSRRTWPGNAPVSYMTTAILPGAVSFALPQDYLQELESWLAPRPIGPRRVRYRGRRSQKRLARNLS